MLSLADYFCLRMKNVNLVIIKRISQYLFSLSGFFLIILVNWPPALTYPREPQIFNSLQSTGKNLTFNEHINRFCMFENV